MAACWPSTGTAAIQLGSQPIVEEPVGGVLARRQGARHLRSGRHTLATPNLPFYLDPRPPFGGKSPFQAAVVSSRPRPSPTQGTKEPVVYRDAELAMVRPARFGKFAVRVESAAFVQQLAGTMGLYTTDGVEMYFKDAIVARLTDLLGENLRSIFDLPKVYDELALALKARVHDDFAKYGIDLADLFLGAITPPEEVQKLIDERSGMAAVGDMDAYMKSRPRGRWATRRKAAAAGGGGGGHGVGGAPAGHDAAADDARRHAGRPCPGGPEWRRRRRARRARSLRAVRHRWRPARSSVRSAARRWAEPPGRKADSFESGCHDQVPEVRRRERALLRRPLLRCASGDAALYVDRAGAVQHYLLPRLVTLEDARRRCAAGWRATTVKDLDSLAAIGVPEKLSFPMWFFRFDGGGHEETLVEPAAPTPVAQLADLRVPAGQLVPYATEPDVAEIPASVPLETARGWLVQRGVAQPRETALVHLPCGAANTPTAAGPGAHCRRLHRGGGGGGLSCQAEAPYRAMAAVGLVLFVIEGLAIGNLLWKWPLRGDRGAAARSLSRHRKV
jgi:hypothetical protein